MESLLRLGSKLLNVSNGSLIFTEHGVPLKKEEIKNLEDNDSLYIHSGIYPYGRKIDEPLRICLNGSGAVGKSAVTMRVIENKFVSYYDPTIEDLFQKVITVDGVTVTLSILDTAGQEDFIGLRSQQMRDKDGFLFIYAVNNHATFEDLDCFYDILMDITETDHGIGHIQPIIMVGNKCDTNDFQVSIDESLDITRQYKAKQHIYTSALDGTNINQMIVSLVREIINHKYPTIMPSKEKNDSKSFVNCTLCTIM